MGEAFHHGGWGMYPTTLFGLVLLVAAVQYARNPAARRLAVIRHLNVLTLLSGTLGVVTGMIKTCVNVPRDELYLIAVGFGESLNNIALALCVAILARIIVTLGAARDTGELVDPRVP
jgi:hypothetical protein